MNISSIDVGSNAIRMVIAQIDKSIPASISQRSLWTVVKKFRAPFRLGTEVFQNGEISDEALNQLVQIFQQMNKLNKKYKVQKVFAVATSAMRDAKNKRKVNRILKQKTGITLKVISGDEEARYIRNSVLCSDIVNLQQSLLIDIGGGSAELTSLKNQQVIKSKSYPLGVVRLLKKSQNPRFVLKEEVNLHLKKFGSSGYHFENAIGTGGNFDALAKLKLSLLKKAPQTNINRSEIEQILNVWNKLSIDEKLRLNIRKDRIDILDIAIPLILYILDFFKIEKLKIPNTGLKEGVIQSYLRHN